MSAEICTQFFRSILGSDDLKQELKAVTSIEEMVVLGERRGFRFDKADVMKASTTFKEGRDLFTPKAQQSSTKGEHAEQSRFYHYEYQISEIPGFEPVAKILKELKIKPDTLDMDQFRATFREEDFRFAWLSPESPGFTPYHGELMRSRHESPFMAPEYKQRDFHLINLDLHVDHAAYPRYFDAKCRMIGALEKFFESEIRFSGSLWYPPNGYRVWHTNASQPGWRMYLVDFDGDQPENESDAERISFFRYMNPRTEEIVTLSERPSLVRFFKIEQEEDKLFWHCIVNATSINRWSFGFVIPDHWMDKIVSNKEPSHQ